MTDNFDYTEQERAMIARKKVTVNEAAAYLGVTPLNIMARMRCYAINKLECPYGYAMQPTSRSWRYTILPYRLITYAHGWDLLPVSDTTRKLIETCAKKGISVDDVLIAALAQ